MSALSSASSTVPNDYLLGAVDGVVYGLAFFAVWWLLGTRIMKDRSTVVTAAVAWVIVVVASGPYGIVVH